MAEFTQARAGGRKQGPVWLAWLWILYILPFSACGYGAASAAFWTPLPCALRILAAPWRQDPYTQDLTPSFLRNVIIGHQLVKAD